MLWKSSSQGDVTDNETEAATGASLANWKDLVKSIASFRGDLSTLTAPPFILAPASLLEYCHFWYAGYEEIRKPALIPKENAEERFLAVVHVFTSIMKQQYTQRNVSDGFEKKPLNPFLGELFVGRVEGDLLRAEQVSHHPPAYAYKIVSPIEDGPTVEQEGHVAIRSRFTTTVSVEQQGKTVYKISDGETYTVGLPPLHLEGFIYAAPFIEVDKTSDITSSESGYKCVFRYSGAGWISGKSHTLKADITDKNGELLYTLSGQWDSLVNITNEKTGETKEFVNHPAKAAISTPVVAPVSEQHELESQRAWKDVADAIRANKTDLNRLHKGNIENAQRELRKKELEEGTEWQHRWFLKGFNSNAEPVWTFSEELYHNDKFFEER